MTTLLLTTTEALIPFFAIFFTFMVPILGMYFYYQYKNKIMEERKLMIEKGLTPPPLKEHNFSKGDDAPKNHFTKGLNLIAISLGLLVGFLISKYTLIEIPFTVTGSILFFLGIVKIIIALKNSNQNNSSINSDNYEKQ